MKSKLIALAGLLAAVIAFAADNDVAAPKWDASKVQVVKFRTTDTDGVHVQHVIVDSGSISPASTAVTNAGTFATQNTQTIGAAFGASTVSSTALEAGHVIKASAGTLISLVGYNAKVTAQFIQVHNLGTLPAEAAVPIYSFTVPASSNFSLDVPISGIPFTTGIYVVNSSTQPTKTIGTTDCWFTAVIK